MSNKTFNPQDQTVTFTLWDGSQETVSYLEAYARYFVAEHLHWNGVYKSVLDHTQATLAYQMCDGFDLETLRQMNCEGVWDWSHVRDSSWQTLVKVADYIAKQKWHLGSIQTIVSSMLADCERVGLNPIELIKS